MVKQMKRAVRRHHAVRLKRARKRYWGGVAGGSAKSSGMCAATPCVCSCWMCGNPHRHHGPTVQERSVSMAWDGVTAAVAR